MGRVAYALVAVVLTAASVAAQTEVHLYSPGRIWKRTELVQLETAVRSVDVAMYSFTDRELAEELATLARKGVRVRVYRDREQLAQEMQGGDVTTSILLAAGVEVRVKGARDLMHLKSYAIDGRLLRSGSANWSPTGLKRQDNDVLYESSPETVGRFEAKFEEMWVKSTNAVLTLSARQLITSLAEKKDLLTWQLCESKLSWCLPAS